MLLTCVDRGRSEALPGMRPPACRLAGHCHTSYSTSRTPASCSSAARRWRRAIAAYLRPPRPGSSRSGSAGSSAPATGSVGWATGRCRTTAVSTTRSRFAECGWIRPRWRPTSPATPAVSAVAVTGVRVADHTVLAAYVVPRQRVGTTELDASIVDYLRTRVPAHLIPSRVRVVPDLVYTASGKVDRHRIKETLP